MNHSGNPIHFQNSTPFPWCFPPSEGGLPIQWPESQLLSHTISPVFLMLPNDQSSYAGDRLNLPAPAGASSEKEVGEKIQATPEKRKVDHWTAEEHRNFLMGLKLHGRGRWKIIAKEAVKTKYPWQVASHAQKYFRRQEQGPEKRKRHSIHDITDEEVASVSQQQSQRLLVAPPTGPLTSFSPQQPQLPVAPPAQPAALEEAQASPTTSSVSNADRVPDLTADPLSQPTNLDQSDELLYLPEWGWASRFG